MPPELEHMYRQLSCNLNTSEIRENEEILMNYGMKWEKDWINYLGSLESQFISLSCHLNRFIRPQTQVRILNRSMAK
jgi:hypothetical protein